MQLYELVEHSGGGMRWVLHTGAETSRRNTKETRSTNKEKKKKLNGEVARST